LETRSAFLVPFHCVECGHDSQENGWDYGNAHGVAPCCSETSGEAHDEGVRNEHTDNGDEEKWTTTEAFNIQRCAECQDEVPDR
jgi:hypothetical protein